MHEIHGGSDAILYDDYDITPPSVDERLMFVFIWANSSSIVSFSLALTVSELRTIFFVS